MLGLRTLAPLLVALLAFVAQPRDALAGPSASGGFSTNEGFSGSSSGGGGFQWPERVVGGNALSFISPFQIGAVGYLPKGRFTFQYDRWLSANLFQHWIHGGASILFDRGDWENFRLDSCDTTDFSCEPGGVVGWDLYAGYTYRFSVKDRPWLVPFVRGSLGFAWWVYPKVGDGREGRHQPRIRSWTLNMRPGGGLRLFLLDQLGVGMDLNIPIGFLVHTDVPDAMPEERSGGFLIGFEIMPLTVEYRF